MGRPLCFFAFVLLVSRSALSAPSCADVTQQLMPCIGYLQGQEPTAECCAGVKNLKGLMTTSSDKTVVCNCCKNALANFNYDPSIIPPLPNKCGVADLVLPPIDKNYDCSKV